MGDIVKGVGAVAGGIGGLFGGKKGPSKSTNEATQDVKRTLGGELEEDVWARNQAGFEMADLGVALQENFNRSSQDAAVVNNLFRDALIRFASGSMQPTAEQIAQSTAFVDETFTKPAEVQFGRFLDQAQTAQQERAAALGRQSTDASYQREFAAQSSQVAQDLANQRAGLIAQRSDQMAFERPQQQLNSLFQGSQFFNQPLQQAVANRLNLLNAATQQQQLGLNRQIASGGSRLTQTGASITPAESEMSMGAQIAGLGNSIGNLYNSFTPTQLPQATAQTTAQASAPSLGGFSQQLAQAGQLSPNTLALANRLRSGGSLF